MNFPTTQKGQGNPPNDANGHGGHIGGSAAMLGPDGRDYFFHGRLNRQTTCPENKISLYAPDFFLKDQNPWFDFEFAEVVDTGLNSAKLKNKISVDLKFDAPNFDDFTVDFETIKNAISKQQLQKAVPIVVARALRGKDFNETVIFENLKSADRSGRALLFLAEPNAGIAGLSPELLFDWDFETNTLSTVALAGTAATANPNDLLTDKKERSEHQFVIDQLNSALSKFGIVKVGDTKVVKAGQLYHLKTEITCQLLKVDRTPETFIKFIELLHPTPALGVKSQEVDFHWLAQLKAGKNRQRFGAPFAVWDPQWGARAYVAIRNIQWNQNEVILATGCGVVAESQLSSEWKELERKRAAILFDLGATT